MIEPDFKVRDPQRGEPIEITCGDGYRLGGTLFVGANTVRGSVIVNAATGVLARYYHYYARFLAEEGHAVVTYDYRGIGASRPPRLRRSGIRWRDWGELDFDAVVGWTRARYPDAPLNVVGHSIGGFLPGFAKNAVHVDRILSMGAQYAYWPDYLLRRRAQLFLKWHIAMPLVTTALGYFPGRRLGWLEDLPAGVAHEWTFRRRRLEQSFPRAERAQVLATFAAVRAPILAVGLTDDEFATPSAIRRGLAYYTHSDRQQVLLTPADLGFPSIGHFGLFHSRHRDGFWRATLEWLRDGTNPWPSASVFTNATRQQRNPA